MFEGGLAGEAVRVLWVSRAPPRGQRTLGKLPSHPEPLGFPSSNSGEVGDPGAQGPGTNGSVGEPGQARCSPTSAPLPPYHCSPRSPHCPPSLIPAIVPLPPITAPRDPGGSHGGT